MSEVSSGLYKEVSGKSGRIEFNHPRKDWEREYNANRKEEIGVDLDGTRNTSSESV